MRERLDESWWVQYCARTFSGQLGLDCNASVVPSSCSTSPSSSSPEAAATPSSAPLSSRTAYTIGAVSAGWLLVMAVASLVNNGVLAIGA
jgi:hypothetical protein